MEKNAIAAKKLLKALGYVGAGAAGATAGGVVGRKVGYRGGAKDMTKAFKNFNAQENRAIAQEFYNRGMTEKTSADQIYVNAMVDELEKLGFSLGAAREIATKGIGMLQRGYTAAKPTLSRIGSQFLGLGKGLWGAGRQAVSSIGSGGGVLPRTNSGLRYAGRMARSAITQNPAAALATAGVGAAGVTGYGVGRMGHRQ